MSQDERPDLELDEPAADLELDQPAPAQKARPEGPWRDPERARRWALADGSDEPLHALELLGEAARSDFGAFQAQVEACRAHLRHLAEGAGRPAAVATMILDSPRFRALRTLDEAGWKVELDHAQFTSEAWYALARDARRIAADGQLSAEEDRELDAWAARLGWTRAALDQALIERVDPAFGALRRLETGLRLRLLSGVVLTRAEQLREVAISGPDRWAEAAESLRDLRLVLDHLHGPEAERLRAALIDGEQRARGGGKILALQATLWALGPPELRLPEPWSPPVCEAPEALVAALDGDADRLLPALSDGRLGLWLERFPGGDALARAVTDREVDPQLRARDLLWSLGERRLSLAGRVVADATTLRALLEHDPDLYPAFDALLARRILSAWARVQGDHALADAASRAAQGADPAMRRQIFVWALGNPELVSGVSTRDDFIELCRRAPDAALALVRSGALSAWAVSRGLAPRPLALHGVSPTRLLHEALWALGAPVLLVRGEVFADCAAFIARIDESLLLHAEPLEADGTVGMWLAIQLQPLILPADEPPALGLRRHLWAAGWTAFHHPDYGFFADPAALGDLADHRPGALPQLAASGWLGAWLALRHPERTEGVQLAARSEDPDEAIARALGLPAPTIEIEPEILDFGAVTEGAVVERVLRLRHRGARGRARVSVALQDARASTALPGANARGQVALGPGRSLELPVRVALPLGQRSAGEARLRVVVDGLPREVLIRYRSRFDLGGLAARTCAGALLGALVLGLWQALLLAAGGQALLAADGGLLTDVGQIVRYGAPSQLGRLGLLVCSLAFGGSLVSLGLFRMLKRSRP